LGIIREAYIEIVERMVEERHGVARRPRLCAACGRLFEPDRVTQHDCSDRCRYRVHQRVRRARRRREVGAGAEVGLEGRTGESASA
jgi:predicted nucleic acid-binding Zn ribbon protein